MTPIIPPPSVPYNSALNAIESFWRNPPPEGDCYIPFGLQWVSDGGSNQSVSFNVADQLAGQPFSQIQAIFVNNIQCGVDVNILAIDTGALLTVPANTEGLFPFMTRGTRFYTWTQTPAVASDKTTFVLFNGMPPPISIIKSVFAQVAAISPVSLTAGGTTPIIASSVAAGTLTALNISNAAYLGGAASGGASVTIQDGNLNALFLFQVVAPTATYNGPPSLIISESNLSLRFFNGLNALVSTFGTPLAVGVAAISATYRVP